MFLMLKAMKNYFHFIIIINFFYMLFINTLCQYVCKDGIL